MRGSANLNRLAFLPLDIAVVAPDFDRLQAWSQLHSKRARLNVSDNPSPEVFAISPVIGECSDDDFFDQRVFERLLLNRHQPLQKPRFLSGFDHEFPEIAKLIKSLPVKVNFAEFLENKADVRCHFDHVESAGLPDFARAPFHLPVDVVDGDLEPASYKIFFIEKALPSFYMTRTLDSKDRVFPVYDKKAYVAAVSKGIYPHGAVKIAHGRKFVISLHGLIDRDRHMELIERSLKKNHLYAIHF